ncbi:MAG: 4-alpha-glucanotransferase [Chloroflexi bacterium]|nr:4-alpha-glucanotransferase [Chloroflexota bacterium]
MSAASPTALLRQLCRLYGVQATYQDVADRTRQPDPSALLAVLSGLGAPVASLKDVAPAVRERTQALWKRPLDPVAVSWDHRAPHLAVRLPCPTVPIAGHLDLESGERLSWEWRPSDLPVLETAEVEGTRYAVRRLPLPGRLPFGYHQFTLELPGVQSQALIIAAPRRAHIPPGALGERPWGVFLPLYALVTHRSWGSGSLADMEALADWAASLGARAVATLPLLPTFLDDPLDPSPYTPVSRLLWSELYLDVDRLPELPLCRAAQALLTSPPWQAERAALGQLRMVDYRRQMALKRQVLAELARCFFADTAKEPAPTAALDRFLETHPHVEEYARFQATRERRRSSWRTWPEALRRGALPTGSYDEDARRYHLYAQWRTHQQMDALRERAKAQGVALYLDLPLGVHPDGYDAWRYQGLFVEGVSTGAPPDAFFPRGQAWGFRPFHPEKVREEGYRYYRACLQHHLRYAGILRIDHVMGVHRLFWVPLGLEPRQGVYVHYRPQEFYAILSLESQRSQAILVGEDLGTIPRALRPSMKRHGLWRSYVAQFELLPDPQEALRPAPADAVASLNTHDTPTFAGFWRGVDIRDRRQLGLLDGAGARAERQRRQELRRALMEHFRSTGHIQGRGSLQAIVRECLGFLGRGPASLVLVNLEDLWLEPEPQNVPGTWDERPNWRRKARYSLETFTRMPSVAETLREVNRLRREGTRAS